MFASIRIVLVIGMPTSEYVPQLVANCRFAASCNAAHKSPNDSHQ